MTRVVEVPVEVTRVAKVPAESEMAESRPIHPLMGVELSTFESSSTGREYDLSVMLPMTYMMSEASFPVIYLPDGNLYTIATGMAAALLFYEQQIPEFILVGVDYAIPNPNEWLETRRLEMGPEGRDNYLQFFEEELIPYIEDTYRVDPSSRTFMGHSTGGAFAMYAMLNASDTFSNYIASAPSELMDFVDSLEDLAVIQEENPAKLFLSVGDSDAEDIVARVEAINDVLTEIGFDEPEYKITIFDNETHMSVWPRTFNNGLRWLFGQG